MNKACGSNSSCDEGSGMCVCQSGYGPVSESDATKGCAQSRQVDCEDVAPEHATSTPGQVEVTFTTGSGWSTPAACAWACDENHQKSVSGDECTEIPEGCTKDTCNGHGTCSVEGGNPTCTCDKGYAGPSCDSCATDHVDEGSGCIDSKEVPCTDAAPEHATSTSGQVTVTYTTAGGWSAAAACAWACDSGYVLVGEACVIAEPCSGDVCNGHGTCNLVEGTPTCTCDAGYAQPNCESCSTDYVDEGGGCIHSKEVPCTDAAPEHATSTPEQVTVTYMTALGWSVPAECAWACDGGYVLVGGACVIDDSCSSNFCDGHGTCDLVEGTPTCTCDAGYAYPHCATCSTDYVDEGSGCIHTKQVTCADAAPEHAISTLVQVTVTYSTALGWSAPAACDWTCDSGYVQAGGECVPSKACAIQADYGTVTSVDSEGEDHLPDYVYADFVLNNYHDTVRFELVDGYGVFASGIRTGSFTLSGADLNYGTCGLCVMLLGDQYNVSHYITGGTVTITRLSGRLTGTLTNATFEEVTIDNDTFVSTPVAGGCQSRIGSMAFDTVLY